MTEQSRKTQITQSLHQYQQQSGTKETLPVPLQRGTQILPVITLPLSVPVLNAKSFRIAPDLIDHASADLVRADPYSPEAQRVIAELVRASHKYAENLKESLKEGQDDAGLITREGILINANTRCVLMRELVAEGSVGAAGIRVAVLPADISDPELLDLEAVIQKQRPHKDDYNLVSELMMLKTLHQDAGMTEEQIAKRQRLPGPKDVMLRLEILSLMETARYLVSPPLPLSTFGGPKSKLQNWKEQHKRFQELEARQSRRAAERQLAEWLFANLVGIDSVHRLRFATEGFLNRHVAEQLPASGLIGSEIVDATAAKPNGTSPDAGLDLLEIDDDPDEDEGGISPTELLRLTVAAQSAGPTGTVTLANGTERDATEITRVLKDAAAKALKDSKRRVLAGERLVAPENLLKQTCTEFKAAIRAIDEVIGVDEFQGHLEAVRSLLGDISGLIEEANDLIDGSDQPETADAR